MSLLIKVAILSTSSTAIQVADATGLYDAISNPGGYGGPNPNRAAIMGILLSITPLSQPETPPGRLSTQDMVKFLYEGGISLTPPAGDGVYVITLRVGFLNVGTLTTDPTNALHFLMTTANTVFNNSVGFTLDALSTILFYPLDQTKPPTTTDGYVTQALPIPSNTSPTVYYFGASNALVYEAGFNCLNATIAAYAGACQCCEGEDLQQLMCRYAEYLAMLQKFNNDADYAGANTLAKKLQSACKGGITPCFVQGTQPNVPFTGNKPVITLQPVNQAVAIGSEVAFAVAATGTAPLIYQWYKNGVLLPGQNGSTLVVSNVQLSDAASFYVIITNAFGDVQSNTITLTVGAITQPVSIVSQPTTQSGVIGGNVAFTVVAAGTAPITYQWFKNGAPISGATAATLNLTDIQSGDIANYYVIITGPTNNVQSSTVTISLGVVVGWGWTSNDVPIQSDIDGAVGHGTIISGAPITADFRANSSPMVLFMFEPTSEPAKTKWYGSVTNNGNIGDPNNDLFAITTIGSTRIYYTVFPTQQNETPIQFLTSSQTPS